MVCDEERRVSREFSLSLTRVSLHAILPRQSRILSGLRAGGGGGRLRSWPVSTWLGLLGHPGVRDLWLGRHRELTLACTSVSSSAFSHCWGPLCVVELP